MSRDGDLVTTVAGAAPVDLFTGPVDLGAAGDMDDGRAVQLDRTRLLVALRSAKQRYGTLLVGADQPIPAEVQPSLQTLAAQTSLGLVNAAHAADLHHLAFHDHLTGLANRSLMREHLSHAVARARRGSPVAVLLIDLDAFKKVNDTYGHAAGDQVLVTVARRLRDGIRGADTAARLNGDEFAVILDGMDASDDALFVAGRLLASIHDPLFVAGVELRTSASIGVATWRGHADIDQLLHDADTAMYAAKSAGRARIAFIEEGGAAKVLSPAPPDGAQPGTRRTPDRRHSAASGRMMDVAVRDGSPRPPRRPSLPFQQADLPQLILDQGLGRLPHLLRQRACAQCPVRDGDPPLPHAEHLDRDPTVH